MFSMKSSTIKRTLRIIGNSHNVSFYRFQQRYFALSKSISRRLESITTRHTEIVAQMNEGGGNISNLGKELSMLAPVASLNERLIALEEEAKSLTDLLNDAITSNEEEMKIECQNELDELCHKRSTLEKRILEAVLPKDEDDYHADAILEIRAGTGGDEASLFANELLEAYSLTAKDRGWKTELLSFNKADIQGSTGCKEAALSISSGGSYSSYGGGANIDFDEDSDTIDSESLSPYGFFKWESGVHRVQRVPINDVKMQTSACSVAVLPSISDQSSGNENELLPPSELRIETMRASGAGGQHVNTTDSAVRITHIPTGITVSIQDERSQHKNKSKALKLIAARVRDIERQEEARKLGEERNSLMGGGNRSERIRTYNYPQDRITDHRCKESTHGIAKSLSGDSNEGLVVTFAPFMRAMHRDMLIEKLEEEG